MPTESVRFAGHAGADLAARLDMPEGPHLATALFAHCFTCGKDIKAARRIAARLAAMGIAVLRFDFTGLGQSEGAFGDTSFSSNVADLERAADYLSERDMAPDLLIGHSLGGAAALLAAGRIGSVRAVVTLSAPADPAHILTALGDALPESAAEDGAEVNLGGKTFRISPDFIRDVQEGSLEEAIAGLDRALLVMHAPRDKIVGIENASRIFGLAKHPKSFVTLGEADHLIGGDGDAEYAAGVIAAWAARYLDLAPPAPPPGAPEGVVRVSEADPDGFLQDVQHGPSHHVLADEPEAYGGTDRGMSPYGFLAAGLGACTSMTIRMYARRKGWPLEHVSVSVTHEKVHAQDAGDSSAPKIDRFHREVTLEGELDADQRARLMEIADRCPVHRTLEARSEIVTAPAGEG